MRTWNKVVRTVVNVCPVNYFWTVLEIGEKRFNLTYTANTHYKRTDIDGLKKLYKNIEEKTGLTREEVKLEWRFHPDFFSCS